MLQTLTCDYRQTGGCTLISGALIPSVHTTNGNPWYKELCLSSLNNVTVPAAPKSPWKDKNACQIWKKLASLTSVLTLVRASCAQFIRVKWDLNTKPQQFSCGLYMELFDRDCCEIKNNTINKQLNSSNSHHCITFLLMAIKAISNCFVVVPAFRCASFITNSQDSCGECPWSKWNYDNHSFSWRKRKNDHAKLSSVLNLEKCYMYMYIQLSIQCRKIYIGQRKKSETVVF